MYHLISPQNPINLRVLARMNQPRASEGEDRESVAGVLAGQWTAREPRQLRQTKGRLNSFDETRTCPTAKASPWPPRLFGASGAVPASAGPSRTRPQGAKRPEPQGDAAQPVGSMPTASGRATAPAMPPPGPTTLHRTERKRRRKQTAARRWRVVCRLDHWGLCDLQTGKG